MACAIGLFVKKCSKMPGRLILSRFLCALLMVALLNIPAIAEEGPSPEDIAFVQGLLIRFGYNPGPVDGICGNQTTAAVRAFHVDRDLPLKPGEIEPQAANVVANLTSHFAKQVIEPEVRTPTVYERALRGDADAARKVGMMYRNGEAVTTDEMMAYAWWSVAETYGNDDAAKLKAELEASGDITAHEMGYAGALAEQICAMADAGGTGEPVNENNERKPQITM